MRSLRQAVAVVAMVGGMGLFGTGVAAAVDNPQFEDCSYRNNTSEALTQVATVGSVQNGDSAEGDATDTATLGNTCVQTAPSFVF